MIRRILLILVLGICYNCSFGQVDNVLEEYVYIDTLPEYPGGEKVLKKTISENLKYPIEAYNDELTGIVKCGFIIDSNGNVTKLAIVSGVRQDIDAEALRVIGTILKWSPAVHDGLKVPVYHTIEVEFVMDRKIRKKMNKT